MAAIHYRAGKNCNEETHQIKCTFWLFTFYSSMFVRHFNWNFVFFFFPFLSALKLSLYGQSGEHDIVLSRYFSIFTVEVNLFVSIIIGNNRKRNKELSLFQTQSQAEALVQLKA